MIFIIIIFIMVLLFFLLLFSGCEETCDELCRLPGLGHAREVLTSPPHHPPVINHRRILLLFQKRILTVQPTEAQCPSRLTRRRLSSTKSMPSAFSSSTGHSRSGTPFFLVTYTLCRGSVNVSFGSGPRIRRSESDITDVHLSLLSELDWCMFKIKDMVTFENY